MNILIMNRRDTVNPAGGGAEVYTFEIARGLVERGASVTIFSSRFAGSASEEFVEGIRHKRKGSELTVHVYGFAHALNNRATYDVIIDEFNGLGFGGFLLPNSMILIHQMYREFWFSELGAPGAIPYVIEPLLLRLYSRLPAVTVSPSTRDDLVSLGFKNVRIVMNALSSTTLERVPEKEQLPTLIYLARLRSTKRPADAIAIYKKVKQSVPGVRLLMAGRGPQEEELKQMAGDDPDVRFLGFVSDQEKFDFLGRSHVLLVPGVREGFGINVIEAASVGTPAVGYDIHGLRDSIQDGDTGLLAAGVDDAATKVASLLNDPGRLGQMSVRCLEYARQFNWKNRAGEFADTLEELTGKKIQR
ncbi:MAG: glycosyltransferase family 4 protein [Thermodesulfovibrionales bacterium]|nr:glycosyltransferase family 4 protein [Thermodesulfovibrionales bacterium]